MEIGKVLLLKVALPVIATASKQILWDKQAPAWVFDDQIFSFVCIMVNVTHNNLLCVVSHFALSTGVLVSQPKKLVLAGFVTSGSMEKMSFGGTWQTTMRAASYASAATLTDTCITKTMKNWKVIA